MNKYLTKELEPLDEIVSAIAEDGFIEIVNDEDIIELVIGGINE
ncbi:hypothetical protein [Brevibacillus sp. 179-C9.3 HS]